MPPPTYQRILVRGVNWLGDAVMTTPALLRLREAHPRARISLLTHAKLKELWQGHPAIDAIETFVEKENPVSIGRRLAGGKFELAVVLPNSPRSAFEMWVARIPRRVGYATPWRGKLLTEAIAARPDALAMRKRSVEEIKRLVAGGL